MMRHALLAGMGVGILAASGFGQTATPLTPPQAPVEIARLPKVEPPPAVEAESAEATELPDEPTQPPAVFMTPMLEPWAVPAYAWLDRTRLLRDWEGSVELGLDGSEGNTQTFNLQFGFAAQRKTEHNEFTLDLDYRKKTADGTETANRGYLESRYERLYPDSPWTTFIHGTLDYDEFQAFDLRLSLDAGVGYQLVKTDRTTFATRAGAGFSREIGSPDTEFVPEAVFGMDLEHRINKRQKLLASCEYTPDMTGWGEFRLKSKASWESLISEQMNLSLKLSVLDRYDSTPNGAEANDVDYTAVLLWKF